MFTFIILYKSRGHTKIKIPFKERIEGIYLISPDTRNLIGYPTPHPDPDNNGVADDSYYVNINNNPNLYSIDNNYITIKLPQVIAYTIVYVKFAPS